MPKNLDEVIAEETSNLEENQDDDTTTGGGDETAEETSNDQNPESESTENGEPEATPDDGAVDEAVDAEGYVEDVPPVVQDLPADVKSYVDEKLPNVEVWGRDGEDGKIEKFTVKTAFDLPDDFIPRSYKDQQIQAQQFAKQDRIISGLETDYQTIQSDNQRALIQQQLEESWAVELKAAQAAGRIPEVKAEVPTDEGFKKASEVIEFMRQENERLAKINAPYRVQSFTQALDLYEYNDFKAKQTETQSKEDALTSKKGSMVGGGRGAKDQFSNLPSAGTTLDSILSEYAG